MNQDRVARFTQIIDDTWKEADRNRLEALPTEDWWEEIKTSTVLPILKDAAAALRDRGYFGEKLSKNGIGVLLRTGMNERSPHKELSFTISDNNVSVSSSEEGMNEIWERAYFSADKVTEKVDQFIRSVSAHAPEPRVKEGRSGKPMP